MLQWDGLLKNKTGCRHGTWYVAQGRQRSAKIARRDGVLVKGLGLRGGKNRRKAVLQSRDHAVRAYAWTPGSKPISRAPAHLEAPRRARLAAYQTARACSTPLKRMLGGTAQIAHRLRTSCARQRLLRSALPPLLSRPMARSSTGVPFLASSPRSPQAPWPRAAVAEGRRPTRCWSAPRCWCSA